MDPGEVGIDSSVSLTPNGQGGFFLTVGLNVTLASVDDTAQAVELVNAAHQVCPYSNATRGNIEVELIANGQPVGGLTGRRFAEGCNPRERGRTATRPPRSHTPAFPWRVLKHRRTQFS